MSGTWADAVEGRGLLPRLPWVHAHADAPPAASPTPRRWRAPLPAAVARALRAGETVDGAPVPRLLAAVVAELVRRYGAEGSVALLVRGAGEQALPLLLEPTGDERPAAAIKAIRDAERASAGLPPLTLASLRAALPALRADERFPIHIAAGVRALPLDGARLQVALVANGARAALVLTADARWLATDALRRFGERLVALLTVAVAQPRAALGRADLLTARERRQLAGDWAGRGVPYPARDSISALLRESARRRPDALAVEDGAHRLSYTELVAQAARLRDALAAAGVKPGARVGVLVERSAAQTVALAGVLEAGAVAVPLDAVQPLKRLQRMAAIVALDAIVVRAGDRRIADAVVSDLKRAPRIVELAPLDHPAPPAGAPLEIAMSGGARAAYVLFTSGSTGDPKGVECPHRAVVRLVVGNRLTRVRTADRVLGHAPFTFDVNLFETWGALLNGAALVQAPAGLLSLAELGALFAARGLTVSCMTPGIFREMAQSQLDALAGLRLLLVAGEAMPSREAVRVARRFPSLLLVNGYGPTENNYTTEYRVRRGDDEDAPVPIGRPIDNTTVYVIDGARQLVPPGMVGELCTGGDGLAIGYVGRADLTAERFVMLTLPGGRRERVYRTGDLVRHRADGVLEFLGRADAQVKVRGHRVELEEVERTLVAAPGVSSAAVVVIGEGASARLRAAVVLASRRKTETTLAEARRLASERLPAYMVPSEFVVVDRIPLTAHEKVDRRAIAAGAGGEASVATRAARSEDAGPGAADSGAVRARGRSGATDRLADLEAALAAIWHELLGTDAVGRDAAFFEVGGTSMLALRLAEQIRVQLGVALPIVRVFEFPSIARMAAHLAAREGASGDGAPRTGVARGDPGASARARTVGASDHRIAIVGMSGRFPGAADPDALWAMLREEREGIRRFARDELDPSIPDRDAAHYSPARGVLDGVELFDPEFFGINPRVAEVTDPQQRLLLEAAWDAFEDAGIVPGDGASLTGVFTGVSHSGYAERHVATRPEVVEAVGDATVLFANDKDYSALHIAHRLDLRGPAMAVQTSSSTSLTAIAMAVQALRAGQCDRALAGGAAVTVPMNSGHAHVEGGMFSRDGRTRTFDADSTGTVFSDGVAMLLLQRLDDAEREGRRVLAVIHGVGVTNDGAPRASFSAPTVQGQEECVVRALADAGWSADSLSYVEAHGTGTPLGDPIEIEALTRAFARSTDRKRYCWIGSVKSNIGHLTAAAGAAGVIKVVQAMQRRFIPRTLHVDRPNPRIDFEHSPFLVARAGLAWESDGAPRRAGVSSFGVGGTNVHLLLEEYVGAAASDGATQATPVTRETAAQDARPAAVESPTRGARMFFLSARSAHALRARARDVARALEADESLPLDGVAATLRHGRKAFERRAVAVARARDEVIAALREIAERTDEPARVVPRTTILLFPGQGAQTAGAGKALYETFPAFRDAIDRCVSATGRIEGRSLRHWLFATDESAAARLRETAIAQPVLFAVEYALGHQLLSAGLKPAAMLGHSIGEFAAAALAGVMTPDDAMRAVTARGRLMGAMPGGAMLAVKLGPGELAPRLGGDLVVAAFNAPRLTVVAGPDAAIAALELGLGAADIAHRRLQTSHAFHSPSMDDAAARFAEYMRGVTLRAPALPFVSCVSGALISDAEATDPAYWARQLREPVRFAEGLAAVVRDRPALLIEAGPREQLTALGRQILPGKAATVALLPARGGDEISEHLEAVGALWQQGGDELTWGAWDRLTVSASVKLPGYPYDRRRLWVEPGAPASSVRTTARGADDLRSLLEGQLHLIEDQISVLLSVTPRTNGTGAAD